MSSPRPPTSGGRPSSTPGAGNTGSGIMDCSSDPDEFTPVQIHTAKCAICDERNMATMRRCPGCTYQVCQPCFTARNGAPLIHGNLGSGRLSGLPSTPLRRRVFNRADSVPPIALSGTAANVSGTATQVGAGAKATASRATPAKRARPKRKGKSKAQVQSDSDSDSADNDYTPADSPTPSKRRKTSGEVKIASEGAEQKKATAARSSARDVPNTNTKVLSGADDEQKEKKDIGSSIVDREKPEGDTIQALLQKHGVDTPSNRYNQHLLHRVLPVRHDPVIPPAPTHPASMSRSSVGAMDMNLQGKGNIKPEGVRTPSGMDVGNNPTVRDFVKNKGAGYAHLRGLILDEDRKVALQGNLITATLTLLSKLNIDIASGSGSLVTLGLDTMTDALNAAQRSELDRVIEETSVRVLNELFPPDTTAQTPSRKDQESAVVLANMSGTSPRIGLFQASPSRRRGSGHIVPSPSAQHTVNAPFQPSGLGVSDERTESASGPGKQRTESGAEGDQRSTSGTN